MRGVNAMSVLRVCEKFLRHDAADEQDVEMLRNKSSKVEYQKQIVKSMRCPACNSRHMGRKRELNLECSVTIGRSYVTISGRKAECRICRNCGYVAMFYDFSQVPPFGFDKCGIDEDIILLNEEFEHRRS